MRVSRKAVGAALTGVSVLGYTWYTKPGPYPPLSWSASARRTLDHTSLGLGPFQYSCGDMGATTPTDRVPSDMKALSLAELRCIKPGLDAPAENLSGLVMTCGADYSLMESRIEAVRKRFSKQGSIAPKNLTQRIPVWIHVKRNLASTPFASYITFEERRRVEQTLVDALLAIDPSGTYHAFPESRSMMTNMSHMLHDLLRSRGLVFEAPWRVYDLSCGFGRHWPDARGVFLTSSGDAVWINGEDHVEIVAEGDMTAASKRVMDWTDSLGRRLSFATDEKNGYMTLKPEDAGTGLKVSASVGMGRLSRHPNFSSVCNKLRINAVPVDSETFSVSTIERFGITNEDAIARAESAIATVVAIEDALLANAPEGESMIAQLLASR